MYSDSKEIRRVSPNLSLRRSPERKYKQRRFSQEKLSSSNYNYSSIRYKPITRCCYCCCPCRCYHFCCNCYCNPCYKLNYDYNNIQSIDKSSSPYFNKTDNINSSTAIGSTKNQTYPNPNIENQNLEGSLNQPKPNPNMENQNNEDFKNQSNPDQSSINQNNKDIINENNQNPDSMNQNDEQNKFNEFLKKLMEVESKIEDAKIGLVPHPDFICDDIFTLFESNNKGYLDEEDLKNGLNLIGLNVPDEDIKLLMKRFDLQKAGHISYADFFDMIVPFEKMYRLKVERRNPTSASPSPEDFSPNTKNGLGELFNLIISSEKEINEMRKELENMKINLRDIFSLIDKQQNGALSNKDFIEYLENNNMINNIREADLLFIRLDKNRNGKIDYSELEDEIQAL